jgi:hypothetical protein
VGCKNWIATYRRLKVDPYPSLCTKAKSKWIEDFNAILECFQSSPTKK